MRIRDELGEVYADARFAAAFGVRGRPGISPGQLMMASVLQFSENLTDRQAAEAVRDRMTWKYALGLELEDPGFDASVLSEFRSRLVAGDLTCLALDALLERLAGLGLVKAGGRQRTDSTHVLGAIRALNRLELAGESLRAALEALAVAAPGWLAGVIDASWQQVYGARIDDLHLPASQAGRQDLMVRYGTDGYYLLEQVHGPGAPGWLRELPAVQALRRIWIQQFYREVTEGRQEVRRREKLPGGDGLPPGRDCLISPYDLDARYSIKRDHGWGGYKVHFTETCDAPETQAGASASAGPAPAPAGRGDRPNLITGVATTEATVADAAMTTPVHQQLEERQLLPGEHLVDSGYPSAELIIHAARVFGITLVSPMLLDTSAQARAGAGYDKAAFAFDFDARQATCPQGIASSSWTPCRQHQRRGDRGVLAGDRVRTLPGTPAVHQRPAPPDHHPLPRTARSARQRPRRADLGAVEGPLRRPRRRRGHHAPGHPRHRDPPGPLPRTAQDPARAQHRRRRDQHDPDGRLLDRPPPGPHTIKPPRPPRLHPHRLTE